MPEGQPSVEFRAVTYRIGDRPVVSELAFEVRRGEVLVLLGRSGSGKTTTLRLINRLIDPTTGEVLVEDRPTTAWDPIRLRRRIGYVIQEIGLFPHLTVEKNVGLVPKLEGWEPGRIRERTYALLEMVNLSPKRYAQRYPHELSGGQRQRVGVARALAADPPILLMDEPFGALDPVTRSHLRQEFRALQQALGKTVVFVTHDLPEALHLASRIGLLWQGRMAVLAEPERFLASDHPEARAFAEPLERPGLLDPGAGRAGGAA